MVAYKARAMALVNAWPSFAGSAIDVIHWHNLLQGGWQIPPGL
jgi:hypothetical protein